ncbi:HAD-IB family hydrolase [Leptotrichia sp. OH3620_COT-345]|uniref:HAD family hydrolase n=1 Tax=Leptotrichia sp. OH3620_COT-345 TaxID=2491048 RepID=UPI000F653905|nr:HAD-IB family hydrolase [Leptotrichia sp. OH3620_COT-345]RRD38987.1 HAD-IB family hydrolase [Leptotrichia sp. OH3620_COT-345]
MVKNIAAFFDIDGTIYRDSLLIEHFKMLVKYEYINMMSWEGKVKEKFSKWETRTGNYDDYLEELVETYVEALKNFSKEDMDFIAKRVIELKGDKVYKYTRERLLYHIKKGHKVIIISGSPDFLVGKMAEKYGVKDYRGSKYIVNDKGIFTGEVIPMWDAKSKKKAISQFCTEYDIDLSKSYAYGDTTGDLTMFKQAGNAIAINPAKKLLMKLKKDKELREKVKIIVERKDVIYKVTPNVDIL